MNARQLEVFRAVMCNRSLTAAAESLHVSQPAVSKLLRHFETQIGYTLFERLGGRLVPTAEAQLLYRDADRIFREIEVLKGLSDRIRDKQFGLLRVGASAPPTFALLPYATERFRQRNPGLRVVLQTLPADAIDEHILLGDIDLGVGMRWSAEAQVRCESLGKVGMVALMRPDSPLAGLKVVRPADLVGQPLISYNAQTAPGRLLEQGIPRGGCAAAGADRSLIVDHRLVPGPAWLGNCLGGRAGPVAQLRRSGGAPLPPGSGDGDRPVAQWAAAADPVRA